MPFGIVARIAGDLGEIDATDQPTPVEYIRSQQPENIVVGSSVFFEREDFNPRIARLVRLATAAEQVDPL